METTEIGIYLEVNKEDVNKFEIGKEYFPYICGYVDEHHEYYLLDNMILQKIEGNTLKFSAKLEYQYVPLNIVYRRLMEHTFDKERFKLFDEKQSIIDYYNNILISPLIM